MEENYSEEKLEHLILQHESNMANLADAVHDCGKRCAYSIKFCYSCRMFMDDANKEIDDYFRRVKILAAKRNGVG